MSTKGSSCSKETFLHLLDDSSPEFGPGLCLVILRDYRIYQEFKHCLQCHFSPLNVAKAHTAVLLSGGDDDSRRVPPSNINDSRGLACPSAFRALPFASPLVPPFTCCTCQKVFGGRTRSKGRWELKNKRRPTVPH